MACICVHVCTGPKARKKSFTVYENSYREVELSLTSFLPYETGGSDDTVSNSKLCKSGFPPYLPVT